MSSLTKIERDALEDIFLSIEYKPKKYQKFKEISSLIIYLNSLINVQKLYKGAKYGLKEIKKMHILDYFSKKKKNLSK